MLFLAQLLTDLKNHRSWCVILVANKGVSLGEPTKKLSGMVVETSNWIAYPQGLPSHLRTAKLMYPVDEFV